MNENILINTLLNLIDKKLDSVDVCETLDNKNLQSNTIREKIQTIFKNEKINPTMIVLNDQNEKEMLLISMLKKGDSLDVANLMMSLLNKEDINDLNKEQQNKILETLHQHGGMRDIQTLFELGYKLIPSENDSGIECTFLREGNLEFFELLKCFQPDYNFRYKYIDEAGKEINIVELLLDYKSYEDDPVVLNKIDNLYIFLKTNILYSNFNDILPKKEKENQHNKKKI